MPARAAAVRATDARLGAVAGDGGSVSWFVNAEQEDPAVLPLSACVLDADGDPIDFQARIVTRGSGATEGKGTEMTLGTTGGKRIFEVGDPAEYHGADGEHVVEVVEVIRRAATAPGMEGQELISYRVKDQDGNVFGC